MEDEPNNGNENLLYTEIEDKPIMDLFESLLGHDSSGKENTVMTNSQMIDILKKEFHIEVSNLHELELDIYLMVLKKYLKNWPQWDEFEPVINELRLAGDEEGIQKIYVEKYKSLKSYLQVMLDCAEPIAKESVKLFVETLATRTDHRSVDDEDANVVLEVHCTRSQLNQLVFRQPHPALNNTIFNITPMGPSRISLAKTSIESIVNWSDIAIHINLPNLLFRRETVHEFNHVLVNKKLNLPQQNTILERGIYERAGSKFRVVERNVILQIIKDISNKFKTDTAQRILLDMLFAIIKRDLLESPIELKVPTLYKKYMSRYPYVRYLYSETNAPYSASSNNYDLQLKETISPAYQYYIGRISPCMPGGVINTMPVENPERVRVECKQCLEIFSGFNIPERLQQHFLEQHINKQREPDWQCTNCKKVFSVTDLSGSRWCHKC